MWGMGSHDGNDVLLLVRHIWIWWRSKVLADVGDKMVE